jgi:hypothetical protein
MFIPFLHNLKRTDNESLIEAIIQGYITIFENIELDVDEESKEDEDELLDVHEAEDEELLHGMVLMSHLINSKKV